jgi:hypothetical protein
MWRPELPTSASASLARLRLSDVGKRDSMIYEGLA